MVNRLLLVLFLTASGLLGGCRPKEDSSATPSKKNAQAAKEGSALPPLDRRFYKGCEKDILALRKTVKIPNPPVRGASPESGQAAARIFERIDFVGMTKEEVLSLLGDPATVNDYGIVAEPGDNSPLKYRMVSGLGGMQYTLEFKNKKVQKLRREGID